MKWKIIFSVMVVIFLVSIDSGCNKVESSAEQLAKKNCTRCHQFPQPGELDKASWTKYVLPQMGNFMGFRLFEGGTYFDDDRIEQSISLEDWNAIVRFYITQSPPGIPTAQRTYSVQMGLLGFET